MLLLARDAEVLGEPGRAAADSSGPYRSSSTRDTPARRAHICGLGRQRRAQPREATRTMRFRSAERTGGRGEFPGPLSSSMRVLGQ